MKVNIDQTIEVSDEQRVQIANVLDKKVSKRQATRVEMKEFLWSHGASWPVDLDDYFRDLNDPGDEALSLDDIL